ncbi:RNA-directed DNA polymerase from mobile element jockey [Caerostris extrusa]|uniref:RNA-directed DNA polymerase from mobile element jockey n=1 Tax=Caerostris extrusa TaxID=172846 RepID=A0AAV4N302_CAEEX|nr:RNA-directed DNA polymerase from mobile element jockey [Caerostris extrusa]
MDPNPGGISSSHMVSTNSASLNRIPTMDNSNEHETEYRSISQQIDDFTSIAQCRANQGNPEYNENPPRSKNTPQAYSSSDTESYSSNMSADVTSRNQTMQVDDDDQQADQPIKRLTFLQSSLMIQFSLHLLKPTVLSAVKISDERKLKSHTYLLPQGKQLKVVILGLPNDFPTKEIEEFLMSEGFEVEFVTQLRHRSGKGNMPLFLVVLPKSEKSKLIFLMENLSYFRIKVEPLRKKAGPAQCFNCQQFFHHSKFCSRDSVFVNCAGPHKAKDCSKPKEAPPFCALCKGNHTSNF